jgi:hypothetical protein
LAYLEFQQIETKTAILTKKLLIFNQRQNDTNAFMQLFESSIVPSELVIELSELPSVRLSTDPRQFLLTRLQTKINELRGELSIRPLPSWLFDFASFLRVLVREASARLNGVKYCLASASEVALSRALLSPQFAPFIPVLRVRDRSEIGVEVCNVVYEVIKASELKNLAETDLMIASFLVHRNLFDICYSSRVDIWRSSSPDLISKVYRLRSVPASSFELPLEFWSKSPIVDESICDFVKRNSEFEKSVDSLSLALFMSNPLDLLYQITVSLTEMRTAAVYNRESKFPNQDPEAISWDHTFLMFLAVFLASDLVDVFAVQLFLSEFAPKRLMPAFDDSRLMWEALAAHVEDVDPTTML